MAKFKVVTASTGKSTAFKHEMEALGPIGAEIVDETDKTADLQKEARKEASRRFKRGQSEK